MDLSRIDPKFLQLLASANSGIGLDDGTKAMLEQFLQNQALLQPTQQVTPQQNENFILIQNAITAGIPTLDIPTISSYLGTVQPQSNDDAKDLASKYQKLLDTIQEMSKFFSQNCLFLNFYLIFYSNICHT